MYKLLKPGQLIFAIGIIALAILCFITKDFIVGRPPAWPEKFSINPGLAYLSGSILIVSAIAIILNKKAAIAALVIAILIFFLSVLRHLPHFMNDWLNTYKAMSLFGGGSLIVASSFNEFSAQWKKICLITGCITLAVFFIAGGYAHFKFADFVVDFIPSYIPFRVFWTYFCGICLLAGGLGLLIPPVTKWASLFSGIMILGWFLLLHIPRFITDTSNASDRMGLAESFTFAAILFVLAGTLANRKP